MAALLKTVSWNLGWDSLPYPFNLECDSKLKTSVLLVVRTYKGETQSNQQKAAQQTRRKRFPHYSKIDAVLELAPNVTQTAKTFIVNFLRGSACLNGD